MIYDQLEEIRDLIREDIGNRGLAADPAANLLTECSGDFVAACQSIAETPQAKIAVVTGFYIYHAQMGETDGPPGALFLARALAPLGIQIMLATDDFCALALEAGLKACHLDQDVGLITLPTPTRGRAMPKKEYWQGFANKAGPLSHLIALERSGPNYDNRCLSMRGLDITGKMSPAHLLFEAAAYENIRTIGIGDGGNEIGMGKIRRDIIGRNIPKGDLVACRVSTDQLIVCGISNWGAYGLAAGVRLLRGQSNAGELFDPETERHLLEIMVERGSLVDGVTGQQTATVDGIDFGRYGDKLRQLADIQ
jgi:D-glutamate cyclase